jgi:hypothetical protein
MARFKADIYTERNKTVSRLGRREIESHIRGWNKGFFVSLRNTSEGEIYEVYLTGGSNNPGKRDLIYSEIIK